MKKIIICIVITICLFSIYSCEKKVGGCTNKAALNYDSKANENDGSCISIGSEYEGGILAYILLPDDPGYDPGVKHGLIAAIDSQRSEISWGCSGIATGGTSTSLGTGHANTLAILNGCSETVIAARYCNDLVTGGYDDWYLPSRDELDKLYKSKDVIGGFASNRYWSSSEGSGESAWSQDFGNDSVAVNYKYHQYYVCPVRSF